MIAGRRILCSVDFWRCSRRALDHAVALARQFGAELAVRHAAPGYAPASVPARERIESRIARFHARFAGFFSVPDRRSPVPAAAPRVSHARRWHTHCNRPDEHPPQNAASPGVAWAPKRSRRMRFRDAQRLPVPGIDRERSLELRQRIVGAPRVVERGREVRAGDPETIGNLGIVKRDAKRDPQGALEARERLPAAVPDYPEAGRVRTMIADLRTKVS